LYLLLLLLLLILLLLIIIIDYYHRLSLLLLSLILLLRLAYALALQFFHSTTNQYQNGKEALRAALKLARLTLFGKSR
jgi:hypothetical protein